VATVEGKGRLGYCKSKARKELCWQDAFISLLVLHLFKVFSPGYQALKTTLPRLYGLGALGK
jgi:hypothetical protein